MILQGYKKQLLERANSLKKSVTKLIEHSGKTFPTTMSTSIPTSLLVCYTIFIKHNVFIFYTKLLSICFSHHLIPITILIFNS